MNLLFRLTLISLLLSSCVSQKRLTYFQGETTNEKIERISDKPYHL
ncbi:MAG: hypothetical protein ACPGRE_05150 [Flavobacteriaceae bacterium]